VQTWTFRNEDAPNVRDGEMINHCFVRMQQRWPGPGGQHVEVRHRRIGRLAVNVAGGGAVSIVRTRSMAEDGEPPVIFMNLLQRGRLRVAQEGRCAEFGPGELVAFDGAKPFRLEASADHRLVSLRLPHELVGRGLPPLQRHFVQPLHAASALMGRMVGVFMTELADADEEPCSFEAEEAARVLTGLLGTLTRRPRCAAPPAAPIIQRLEAYVAEHHAAPGLRPEHIARDLGLSLRQLHQACALTGRSCMTRLYSHRLERARALLLSGPAGGVSIAEVASTCGFSTAAHFSRRFAAGYGYPPTALTARRTHR
jgi:AraC-like DNA-binding protein